jgi:OOP family OmpA-OmpF porin
MPLSLLLRPLLLSSLPLGSSPAALPTKRKKMNTLSKFVFAAAAVMTFSASAQTNINAPTPYSAYVQDARGVIARSGFGLCYRTGYWTPADAVAGCDAPLAPLTCTPPLVAVGAICIRLPEEAAPPPAPPKPPAPAPAPRPAASPTSEKVTFQADALFDFDKAVLKPEGKAKIDDLASKLKSVNLEVIIAIGHTDSVGTDAYNQKLSERRANAVKAYMKSKGIDEKRIFTEGKGEKQPVADNKTAAGRAQNRRVEIEVVGTRK